MTPTETEKTRALAWLETLARQDLDADSNYAAIVLAMLREPQRPPGGVREEITTIRRIYG